MTVGQICCPSVEYALERVHTVTAKSEHTLFKLPLGTTICSNLDPVLANKASNV